MYRAHVIERAYQIARSGTAETIDDLNRHLIAEGYEGVHMHIAGSLRVELRGLMRAARPSA